ncbi:MAG TPA: lysozyme inhibitor LprI family protein [Syntrophorhabdaceae bacterium]|jgi:hypothetical protein
MGQKDTYTIIYFGAMKRLIIGFLMCIVSAAVLCAQEAQELVSRAERAYRSGNEEAAKGLYLKAAAMGSAEAHYRLAVGCHMIREERIRHYSEAAKSGHVKAFEEALDMLLFQANSLTETEPQIALNLYLNVKKANPKLNTRYYEEEWVRTIKMCAEAKGFDASQFMKKYGINKAKCEFYSIWELAEEASGGGRFGQPDPELVFNLVMRGGWSPVELISAVKETYGNWKNGTVKKFDICDYVQSGYGQSYCAAQKEEEDREEENSRYEELKAKLNKKGRELLGKALRSADKFFEERAENEEGFRCGTAHAARVLSSRKEHGDEYLSLVEKVLKNRFMPSPEDSLRVADQKLNKIYQDISDKLKKDENSPRACVPTREEIKTVQRLWITYRDASTRLFVSINPAVNETTWKSWLTERRQKELESVLELVQ